MSVHAVEGPAGCGKTYRLMELLTEALTSYPMEDGQRVLALTFMHGARQRLNDRLRNVDAIGRRFECLTIDSFAWRILQRWRTLARTLREIPEQPTDFDEHCDLAGELLEQEDVRGWVSRSFPLVVIDEAQDLSPERLRIVIAIAGAVRLFIAADEFQCLTTTLRPNPLVQWLRQTCKPEALGQVRRTRVPELLAGALAIREGHELSGGGSLRIVPSRGQYFAAAALASAIAWRRGGTVAVITPALAGGFAHGAVERVSNIACGRHKLGPFPIRWDRSIDAETAELLNGLDLNDRMSEADALAELGRLTPPTLARAASDWVRLQSRAGGRLDFERIEIEQVVSRQVAVRRQRFGAAESEFVAMTVHQAKNREFDGVVVLWPYQVGGDDEQKRRMLYNAVTRARRWCTIVVQNASLLKQPPFR